MAPAYFKLLLMVSCLNHTFPKLEDSKYTGYIEKDLIADIFLLWLSNQMRPLPLPFL